jgi:amino acid transporter
VVLFLRINLIVGEAGIFWAYAILFFGKITTFLTVLSMNAIATNGKIRTGGVYYLISRSLGPATGGCIGILDYLANTFTSAMSILGAIEAIHVLTGFSLVNYDFSMRFFSFLLLLALVITVLFGVRFVTWAGLIIIIFVFISILSIIIGLFTSGARSEEL